MSFLATPSVNDWGENVFKLTPYGLMTVGVLIALLVAIAIVLRPKSNGYHSAGLFCCGYGTGYSHC